MDALDSLDIGDRIKNFEFPLPGGRYLPFDVLTLSAKPVVLLVASHDAGEVEVKAFARAHQRFESLGIAIVALIDAPCIALPADFSCWPFPVLPDPQRKLRDYLGIASSLPTHVLLAGPDLRVAHRIMAAADWCLAEQTINFCHDMVRPVAEHIVDDQPPIVLIRNALSATWCQRLIAYWQENEKIVSNVTRGDGGANVQDTGHKRRRDVPITDKAIAEPLLDTLRRHVLAEVDRYFGYEIRSGELLRIGCYEAENSGQFRLHRDNNTAANARRRFAMSLDLNDDYAGGLLRFPEFPGPVYRLCAGNAVVFSCSLLHEATPVTSGRRFGLFAFFWCWLLLVALGVAFMAPVKVQDTGDGLSISKVWSIKKHKRGFEIIRRRV